MAWIHSNLREFSPEHLTKPTDVKAFSELTILYAALTQCRAADLGAIRLVIMDFLDSPASWRFVKRLPSACDALLPAYYAMRRQGLRVEGWEAALHWLDSVGYPRMTEVMIDRPLEHAYFRFVSGWTDERPDWRTLFETTTLARCHNPIYLADTDVYSITHEMFYLTDFGGDFLEIDQAIEKRIEALLASYLTWYVRYPNWDLVVELLINLLSIRRWRHERLILSTIEAVLRVWRDDGAVPLGTQRASDEGRSDFERHYHTTLVALLFAVRWRQRQDLVPGPR